MPVKSHCVVCGKEFNNPHCPEFQRSWCSVGCQFKHQYMCKLTEAEEDEMIEKEMGSMGENMNHEWPVEKELKKFYVSFGQAHIHSLNGRTFDKNRLAEIEAVDKEEAHKMAMEIFKGVFCNVFEELPNLIYFPDGVVRV